MIPHTYFISRKQTIHAGLPAKNSSPQSFVQATLCFPPTFLNPRWKPSNRPPSLFNKASLNNRSSIHLPPMHPPKHHRKNHNRAPQNTAPIHINRRDRHARRPKAKEHNQHTPQQCKTSNNRSPPSAKRPRPRLNFFRAINPRIQEQRKRNEIRAEEARDSKRHDGVEHRCAANIDETEETRYAACDDDTNDGDF